MVAKKFVVVAYDITNNRRRKRVSDRLCRDGSRVNLSVFEVLVTESNLKRLRADLTGLMQPGTDTIIYYLICLDCIARIERTGVGSRPSSPPAVLSV
jgi:CRISPR-associated protein Cas2